MNVESVRERFSSLQNGFAFFDAPGGTQVPDEVGQAIAAAVTGQKSVDDVLNGAQTSVENTMKEAGYIK